MTTLNKVQNSSNAFQNTASIVIITFRLRRQDLGMMNTKNIPQHCVPFFLYSRRREISKSIVNSVAGFSARVKKILVDDQIVDGSFLDLFFQSFDVIKEFK